MDSSTPIALAIAGVLLLAGVMVIATGQRRAGTGRRSREAVRADASVPHETTPRDAPPHAGDRALSGEARRRAEEARQALVPAGDRGVAVRRPVDEEELGLSRRQFFNRGLLTALGISAGAFGAASLAFLWPGRSEGFGGKINVGSLDDVRAALESKEPFYNASAKTYIVAYPEDNLDNAETVYESGIVAGMEQGYVALYQKCPHLGCRVPWCKTSQWFECPCHGSKYNRVGEKRGGPAPRGMDRFVFAVSGSSIEVDTGTVVAGPPVGTDTTGQSAEGPLCV